MPLPFTTGIERAMTKTWKQKALAATRDSQLGAILCAAIGTEIDAPRFTSKAVITSDGFVTANFDGADGRSHLGAFVRSASDLVQLLKSQYREVVCMFLRRPAQGVPTSAISSETANSIA
jgi:hypothetical protein